MILDRFLKGKLRLNRPFNQNFIMGCILFCLPGIYLALTGLGAGGGRPSSQHVASLTNSYASEPFWIAQSGFGVLTPGPRILYGVYTVMGWLAGGILNYLKPKYTIAIGAVGYPLYVGSLWYYDRVGHEGFPLAGGAILGFCAALLWTASGFIQFAYPTEADKAKYITWQWVLTSTGSTVGALIAFGANFGQTEAVGVATPVYVVFIVIMCFAILLDLLLIVDPKDIVRDDGRHLAIFKTPNLKDELKGIFSVLIDPKIILLLPAMFVGEMCLALTSSINAYYFNLRTRSLNNLLFQFIMIPAPICLAYIMDNKKIASRRTKGLLGVTAVSLVTFGATAGLMGWTFENNIDRHKPAPGVDWSDSAFAAGFILYLLFGIVNACFQIAVQWTMSALTNDPALCARYAGAFKGTVSFGMCISFTIDSQGMNFKKQIIVQLVLYVAGVISLYYVVFRYVKQTNYFLEDAVIVPEVVEQKLLVEGAIPPEQAAREHAKEEAAEGKGAFGPVEEVKEV